MRRGRYAAYIVSDDWFRRREQWYRDWVSQTGSEPSCAICGVRWTLMHGDLHHRTYAQLGSERHNDLVPLCRAHHTALHDIWDASSSWRKLGRAQATDGIIAALRRRLAGGRR
jgi:hypothetical protein